MKVLLSIKPEFAEKIFDGSKRFEFRKSIFRNRNVKTIVVYASSPVKKVIGEFDVDCILEDKVENIWEKTKKYSGIDKDFYMEYFNKKENAFAIKVKSPKKYKKHLDLKENYGLVPPQSFAYINK